MDTAAELSTRGNNISIAKFAGDVVFREGCHKLDLLRKCTGDGWAKWGIFSLAISWVFVKLHFPIGGYRKINAIAIYRVLIFGQHCERGNVNYTK